MDVKTSVGQLASLAQSEALWALFVGSGQAGQVEEVMLRRAQKDLERTLGGKEVAKGSQEHRRQGAERIRGYLAGAEQSGTPG